MSRLSFYLAGPSRIYPECRFHMRRLIALGYRLTFDWTLEIEHLARTGSHSLSPEAIVEVDLRGVQEADVLVLVLEPEVPTVGAWVELGYALALNKPVVAYLLGSHAWWEKHFANAPWLRAPGVKRAYTQEQLVGYLRILEDQPIYVSHADAPEVLVAETLGHLILHKSGIEAEA